jgi:zinc transporter
MQESLARRTYTMSLMAMVFLPSTFLTGLFGVNLGGIPGGGWRFGFALFCIMLVILIGVLPGGCIVVNGCKISLF